VAATNNAFRILRRVAIALAIGLVLGAGVLWVTPPKPVLRELLVLGAGRLLSSQEPDTPSLLSKSISMYYEYALAGNIANDVAGRGIRDDVARIDYAVRRVQLRVLTQMQVSHRATAWPTLVSGLGWCDQVNAVAARVLAHSFAHAQLYALYDPGKHISPHTIGRVWSDQRHEWLYFDAFWDRPIVFHRTTDGKAEILNVPAVEHSNRLAPPPIYHLGGWVLNEYPSAFPKYLAAMAVRRKAPDRPKDLLPGDGPPDPHGQTPPQRDGRVFARLAPVYVRARAEDLVGDHEEARREYQKIASDPDAVLDGRAQLLRDAAREFAGY
jgi:hypothetical protein